MGKLLPPFHKPMDSEMQCHLANDRIAELERDLRIEKDQKDLYRHLASHLMPREYREAKARWDETSRACDVCSRIDYDDKGDCPLSPSSRPRVNCDAFRP